MQSQLKNPRRNWEMTRPSTKLAVAALGLLLLAASSSHAQVLAPGNRPTLSPWFGLYQRNSGPLDNYHTFVRPQIQLENTLQRHQVAIQRNYEGVASLDREMSELTAPGQVHPTGIGSGFMNYSHYYPSLGGSAVRPGRGARPSPPRTGHP
jgi:hypothetical protein